MKSRLQDLYERDLVPPGAQSKQLPLEHILKKPMAHFPDETTTRSANIIEIGPGTGDFLFHLAEQYSDQKILGVEIGPKRFHRICDRIQKRSLLNVSMIFADARIPFHKHIPDNSVDKIFVLFPDPWPKNKHRHMRLLQQDFLKVIFDKLKLGGEFTHATDVEDYARWVLANLKTLDNTHNDLPEGEIVSNLPDVIPTFFKQKWQKLGRSFHYLRFRKV